MRAVRIGGVAREVCERPVLRQHERADPGRLALAQGRVVVRDRRAPPLRAVPHVVRVGPHVLAAVVVAEREHVAHEPPGHVNRADRVLLQVVPREPRDGHAPARGAPAAHELALAVTGRGLADEVRDDLRPSDRVASVPRRRTGGLRRCRA